LKKIATSLIVFVLLLGILANGKQYATTEQEQNPEAGAPETTETEEATEDQEEIVTSSVEATAIVIEVGEIKEVQTDYVTSKMQEVKVEILEGEYETKEFTIDYLFSYDVAGKNHNYELEVGDKVSVQITKDASGNITATIRNLIRNTYIIVIVSIFLLSLVMVAGKNGIKAILSLGVIFISILMLIKGIYKGYHAVGMTMAISMIILLIHAIVVNGFNRKAMTVVLGTFGGIMMSGILAIIFSRFGKLSGMREDTITIELNMININFYYKDLIFAGIVIASLGICLSIAMSLVSRLEEVKKKTEDMSWKQLFKEGMKIGGTLLGSMINAFILIYISSSLTIIFMFLAANMGMTEILNKETIAENITSAMTGSMGMIFTVPFTSAIYAVLNRRKTIYKTTSQNKLDGNRSLKI